MDWVERHYRQASKALQEASQQEYATGEGFRRRNGARKSPGPNIKSFDQATLVEMQSAEGEIALVSKVGPRQMLESWNQHGN